MAFDAFISYSSKDKTAADAACAVLEASGIRCWIAPRDIQAGRQYGAAIIDAIDNCRVMVLIFSSSANNSNQIHREIERVVAKGVPIVPVRIEEVTPTQSMEYFLGGIHWLDALSLPLEGHLQQLTETVKAILQVDTGRAPASNGRTTALGNGAAAASPMPPRDPVTPIPADRAAVTERPRRSKWLLPVLAAALALLLLGGGIWLYQRPSTPAQQAATGSLRASAQARGFMIGAAAAASALREEQLYSQTLAREFNVLTPENAMKFAILRPSRTDFNFADADTVLDFADKSGMKIRGGPLVWDGQLAPWLINGKFTAAEISAILKEHIQTLVARYRGRVYAWDVTNNALDDLGKVRGTIWSRALGDNYLSQVFLWAREADPAVKLFLNNSDNFQLQSPDPFIDTITSLKGRGVPIDGIGLHSHWILDRTPKLPDLTANMKRLAALGLEIHVTEFDLRMAAPATDLGLQRQAAFYRDYLNACLSIINCKAFITWGFTDKYSWIPRFFPGFGAALPLDGDYRPKPAYAAMLDALNTR